MWFELDFPGCLGENEEHKKKKNLSYHTGISLHSKQIKMRNNF